MTIKAMLKKLGAHFPKAERESFKGLLKDDSALSQLFTNTRRIADELSLLRTTGRESYAEGLEVKIKQKSKRYLQHTRSLLHRLDYLYAKTIDASPKLALVIHRERLKLLKCFKIEKKASAGGVLGEAYPRKLREYEQAHNELKDRALGAQTLGEAKTVLNEHVTSMQAQFTTPDTRAGVRLDAVPPLYEGPQSSSAAPSDEEFPPDDELPPYQP